MDILFEIVVEVIIEFLLGDVLDGTKVSHPILRKILFYIVLLLYLSLTCLVIYAAIMIHNVIAKILFLGMAILLIIFLIKSYKKYQRGK